METLVEARARSKTAVDPLLVAEQIHFEACLIDTLRREGLFVATEGRCEMSVEMWLHERRTFVEARTAQIERDREQPNLWLAKELPREDFLLLPAPGVRMHVQVAVRRVLDLVARGRGTRCVDGWPTKPMIEVDPCVVYVRWQRADGALRGIRMLCREHDSAECLEAELAHPEYAFFEPEETGNLLALARAA